MENCADDANSGTENVLRRKIPRLEDYEKYVNADIVERVRQKAEGFKDVHVAHVNSAFHGGGVAELLTSLTLLMNSAGIKTGWRLLQGAPDYFSITKKMHNALQGGKINLTDRKKEIYEDVVEENALRNHLDRHDFVIIHDPQPLPLIEHYKKRGPWIWRCHIDMSEPDRELWRYLQSFIEKYDAVVFTLEEYIQKLSTPQLYFMPGIDPFSIKNREMTPEEINERLEHHCIPTDLPLVAQISRFDRWKDPQGVIKAFKMARREVDATLVLLGNFAADDPEGKEVYESMLEQQEERILILSTQDTALVNALQRAAAVVLQKSLREGFGLTVTEAMWKGAAVIGGNTGGIRYQIQDGVNGYLVSSVEDAANRIVSLIKDQKLRRKIGQKAIESVRDRFLMIRYLEDYLNLFSAFETLFRLKQK